MGAARSDGKTLNPGNSSQLPHSTTPAWLQDMHRASAPGTAVQHRELDAATAASVRKEFVGPSLSTEPVAPAASFYKKMQVRKGLLISFILAASLILYRLCLTWNTFHFCS